MPEFEAYVDADTVAAFLKLTRRRVLELVREAGLPGRPVDHRQDRHTYRFRLSAVIAWMEQRKR